MNTPTPQSASAAPEHNTASSVAPGASADPPQTSAQDFAERRRQLSQHFGGPLLVASGELRPRNFPHNAYPYRAESHFLYLVGPQRPGSALWMQGEEACLFVPVPPADDALWHGPSASPQELSERLGIPVLPLAELSSERCAGAATIAPQDPGAAAWLSERLGRPISQPPGDDSDRALAEALIAIRLRADAAALRQLRWAADVTAQAHGLGMLVTRRSQTEAEVCGMMLGAIWGQGMQPAYGPIVTVHGEVLHSRDHGAPLSPGDLLLCDVGAETPEGWAADVTRTWPVSGRFSSTQRDVYQAVLEAQAAALSSVRPGTSYVDVHLASQRSLMDGLRQLGILRGSADELWEHDVVAAFYPHGVGHLLGIDVHDMEDLGDRVGYGSEKRDPRAPLLRLGRPLEAGMVVTVEPGFYQIPGLLHSAEARERLGSRVDWERLAHFSDVRGIRIEDDVLVTADGPELLSADAPKECDAIEALMAGPG